MSRDSVCQQEDAQRRLAEISRQLRDEVGRRRALERRLSPATLDVVAERERQDVKWGAQNHPDGTGAAWRTSAANGARRGCEAAFAAGRGTWAHIMEEEVCEALVESDPALLREELVQVAAVAVAWVEAIDRRAT